MAESLTMLPCCPPISQSELTHEEAEQLAASLKAVADPDRAPWEIYTVLEDAETMGSGAGQPRPAQDACCS
jgi:hypothetical protein